MKVLERYGAPRRVGGVGFMYPSSGICRRVSATSFLTMRGLLSVKADRTAHISTIAVAAARMPAAVGVDDSALRM